MIAQTRNILLYTLKQLFGENKTLYVGVIIRRNENRCVLVTSLSKTDTLWGRFCLSESSYEIKFFRLYKDYKGNSVEAKFETRMIAASLRHVLLVPSAITSDVTSTITSIEANELERVGHKLLRLSITCELQHSQPANAFFATVNQVFVDSSQLPTTDQIVEQSSDNETVLGSSRKLGGVAEHLIDGSKKNICRLSFEF